MRYTILLFLSVFLCLGCSADSEILYVLFKSSGKLDNPYGLCTHINRKDDRCEFMSRESDLSMICQTGATFIRTDIDWPLCMTSNGYDFTLHRTMLESVEKFNLNTLAILWPSTLEKPFSKWEEYVEQTMDSMAGRIRFWELVNEADLVYLRQHRYKAADYAKSLRRGSEIIKGRDPKATILFSGISRTDKEFLDTIFSYNVSECFDVMNVHFYANGRVEPESVYPFLADLSDYLGRYHVDKPIWLTETGCTTGKGYVNENIQAQRLPRMYLVAIAAGVEKVFWYKSRACELSEHYEDHFGIWHKDYSPKTAFFAYKTLTNMCPSGSQRPQIRRNHSLYVASWKQKGGKYVTAIWTTKGNESVTVSSKGLYECYSYLGKKLGENLQNINVSPSIVYLIGKKKINISIL